MPTSVLALSITEGIDLVVAGGTVVLALATFSMARATTKMAAASKQQAEFSRQQLEMATMPMLRIVRIGQPHQADMVTVNEGSAGEALVLYLENRAAMPVEVGYCALSPGGEGKIVDHDEAKTPAIEPNGDREFEFFPTPSDKAVMRSGKEVTLRVQFNAIPSLVANAILAKLQFQTGNDGEERWIVLSEEPTPVARAFSSPDSLHIEP